MGKCCVGSVRTLFSHEKSSRGPTRALAEYFRTQAHEWMPREARIVASPPDYVPPPPEALNGGSLPGVGGAPGQWAVSQGDD